MLARSRFLVEYFASAFSVYRFFVSKYCQYLHELSRLLQEILLLTLHSLNTLFRCSS
jgi:hypothetical protein